MENGKIFSLIVFALFIFVTAILIYFMKSEKQTAPPHNFPTLQKVCERCSLVKGLPYQDRFETPVTRFAEESTADVGDLPRCVHTYSVPEDHNDKPQPLRSDCCLASVDPIMACPAACFDLTLGLDDGMKGSIARMRSNNKCWNSDTVPDAGFLT
jgi:hypothetical protein